MTFSHQVFRQNDEVFRQVEGKLKLVEGQVNMVEGQVNMDQNILYTPADALVRMVLERMH